MRIEVLGPGCAKCNQLAEVADQAARGLGLDYELVKITALNEIMDRGVIFTPGLSVNGALLVSGKVPSEAEMQQILTTAAANEQ